MAVSGDLTPARILARLDEVEVVVEKLVAGGDGLARIEGVPIFVPRSVPGERLRVRIVQRRPHYGRAEIVEVLEAGAGRVEPRCRHFAHCGGCDLQQLDSARQGREKVRAARETLARLGRFHDLPGSTLVEGAPFGYRTRVQWRARRTEEGSRLGYFARGSHDFVPVEECPVLAPELEAAMPGIAAGLPEDPPDRIDACIGSDGDLTFAPVIEGLPRGPVSTQVGDLRYHFDARTFFQTHNGLLADLSAAVCGSWTGETAYDLYAGAGLFSLPLSRLYARVVAVESDPIAARFARRNARANAITNVDVKAHSLETWIHELPVGVDRVVVNPPRAGLSLRVSNLLTLRPPQRITYLSCHPASLARDLRALAGAFEIESLAFFDLFPQTGHIETLVQLRPRSD